MPKLREILDTPGFKIGVELVSTRGTSSQKKAEKTLEFGNQLSEESDVDWISITDNAGGHPAISPTTIGHSLLNKGKSIIVHMTCKDYNRNGLESKAWELSSEGFDNILAITGDYPAEGISGVAKPVFDLDSISLLYLLNKLNNGLTLNNKRKTTLDKTDFYLGAVVSNFKKYENELLPQYFKLLKKIELGASYIINQVGFDASKMSELIHFLEYKKQSHIHMIGNVFVLSKFTANLFYKNLIPGVVLTKDLYNKCQKAAQSPDKGKSFFLEFAAKTLAIYKGLGYKGGYLGGVHNIGDYKTIIETFNSYGDNDWKQFAQEMQFSQEDEFFMFEKDNNTGLVIKNSLNPQLSKKLKDKKNITLNYQISKRFHNLMFTEERGLYPLGKKICSNSSNPKNAPNWLYKLEGIGKRTLFDCHDCGDCSLQEISYLCPESQCAKNQRNGPCGGTYNSRCEVKDSDCIWARAYDRHKYEMNVEKLLDHVPTIQNHQLLNTSSWGNFWLEKDHNNK